MTLQLRPLALDLAERIEALRREVEGSGHEDIENLLDLAGQLAQLRAVAQTLVRPAERDRLAGPNPTTI